jgi:hypothetical protein
LSEFRNLFVASNKIPQLIPRSSVGTPKVEATNAVLLDGGALRGDVVKLPVVAKDDPAVLPDLAKPLVVGCILFEAAMLMPLYRKRRISLQDGDRKASAKAPIKIEG